VRRMMRRRLLTALLLAAGALAPFAVARTLAPSTALAQTAIPPNLSPAADSVVAALTGLLSQHASESTFSFTRNRASDWVAAYSYVGLQATALGLKVLLHVEERAPAASTEGACIEDRALTLSYADLASATIPPPGSSDSVLNDFARYRGRTSAVAAPWPTVSVAIANASTTTTVRTSATLKANNAQFECPSVPPRPTDGVTFLVNDGGEATRLTCLLQRLGCYARCASPNATPACSATCVLDGGCS